MAKVLEKESRDIKNRYEFLIGDAEVSKMDAITQLMTEFERPRSTIYDHISNFRNKDTEIVLQVNSELLQNFDNKKVETVYKPKILLCDIETFANLAYVWAKYDQNVIDFEREWFVLCFCYKWQGKDEIYSVSLPDFEEYEKDKTNDYYVTQEMWKLFDEADIVVGHNADRFDIRKMYARFLYHGFPPPSPFKSVDTLKIARRYFNMNSNKLDDIGRYLGIGRKKVHTGWDLWKRCFLGDSEAWGEMIEYNTQDIVLLEKVYDKFKPYITNHPNMNLLQGTVESCPNCGSENLQKRGYSFSRVTKTQRFQCQDCFAWCSGNKLVR